MDSHVTVNVVEPGSSIPVPNTGVATMGGLSGYETGIVSVGLIVVVLAIIAAIVVKKRKNDHKIFDANKGFRASAKKRLLFGVIILAVLCGAFGFGVVNLAERRGEAFAVVNNTGLNNGLNPDPTGPFDNTLTISVSDININVELEDKAVFAYAKSDVKVTTPTAGGYVLYMYADEADLTNEKTGDKIRSLPAITDDSVLYLEDGDYDSFKLTDNSWGVTDMEPTAEGKDSVYWVGLPTSIEDAYDIHSDEVTQANDATTLYFGTYVTPDLPYGTYEGSTINYVAIANYVEPEAVFYYYGDNVYFDEGRTQTENAVGFSLMCEDDETRGGYDYSSCTWMKVAGKYKDPILGDGQVLRNDKWKIGGNEWIGRGEDELLNILNAALEDDYVLDGSYGVFGEVIDYFTITFDANGGSFTKSCVPIWSRSETKGLLDVECEEETVSSVSVQYDVYSPAELYLSELYVFNHDSLRFLGWSTDPNAQYPMYYERDDIPTSELLKGEEIKLYAVWGRGTDITRFNQ